MVAGASSGGNCGRAARVAPAARNAALDRVALTLHFGSLIPVGLRGPVLDSVHQTARADGLTPAADAFHDITLELFTADDPGAVAGKLLPIAMQLFRVDTVSIWIPAGASFECRGATGEDADRLTGTRVEASSLTDPIMAEDGTASLSSGVAVDGQLVALLRVTRSFAADGAFTDAEQERLRRLTDIAGAAMANAKRLATSERAATDSSRDLGVLTDVSREITSTLDLDRVLRSVVNLAGRLLRFDRGAIGLYERGACDIRAVAGADAVDSRDPAMKDLAVRAAWAAGRGERFYVSDRADPASDAERTFVQIFGADLERDDVASGLYLPLKDDEGIVGILLFEASRNEFTTPRQRELAEILANQATVAVRNAQLYRSLPMADTLGALAARKEAMLALPRQRLMLYLASTALIVAALTLIRWPMRVSGIDPVFRSLNRQEIRPTIAGVVDRVLVLEGASVTRGAAVAHLRDDELRAEREGANGAVLAAERAAAMAAARNDPADEQLQRMRADVLRRDVGVLDEEIGATTIRSAVAGVVLTPRPEERIGIHVDAGQLLLVIGRTDSLELDFTVDQSDIGLVHLGDVVRLRVDALPQRTFSGRVVALPPLSVSGGDSPRFPVRAMVASEGVLRPGMTAYARVLTAPASVLGRLTRAPLRAARLFWWRIWS